MTKTLERLCILAAAMLTLTALAFALELPRRLGIAFFEQQYLSFMLGLAILLAFIHGPKEDEPSRHRVALNLAVGVAGFAACLVIAVIFPTLFTEMVFKPWYGILLGAIVIFAVLESTRRLIGIALLLVVGAFILYALFSRYVPSPFQGRSIAFDRLAVYLGMDANAILGGPLQITCTIVIAFIFMGQVMSAGSAGAFFREFAFALFGRQKGGAAKVSIFSSLLFGSVSGSAVGNVVSTGMITIDLMKRAGFDARRAGAIEAVASTGGQIVPPVMGATAFLMAEFLQVPYSEIALAAIVPAGLYYLALWLSIDFNATRHNIQALDPSAIPKIRDVLKDGWHVPIPIVLLVVCLFWLHLTPQLSAIIAAAGFIVTDMIFGYGGKRMTVGSIGRAIVGTGFGVIDIVIVAAAAGVVIGILSITGLGFAITLQLTNLAGENVTALLLVTAVASIILGMGMPTVAVYVLLATLMGTALGRTGLDPIAAHLFIMYFGMLSMITPPVALASFAAASLAKAPMLPTAISSMQIGWTAYFVPFIFVFEPGLILRGDLFNGGLAILTACAGVYFITAALSRWFGRLLGPVEVCVALVAGAGLLFPAHGASYGFVINAIGAIFAVGLIALRLARRVNGSEPRLGETGR